jgi:Leucine-rich repeat (LRR) protein
VIGEGTKTRANSCNADSIRLCNNQLTSLSGLERVAHHLLEDPADLAWLDVSFNQLTRIDDIVASFPNLKVLYLHGNQIKSLNEVLKLQALPHLTKLTLHGNPVSEKKDYKAWVLSHLPAVRDFDFSPVTKLDREKITQWFAAYSKKHAQ